MLCHWALALAPSYLLLRSPKGLVIFPHPPELKYAETHFQITANGNPERLGEAVSLVVGRAVGQTPGDTENQYSTCSANAQQESGFNGRKRAFKEAPAPTAQCQALNLPEPGFFARPTAL